MKVRIQDTVEFHKDEVRVLKRLAEESGYDSWREFVSWRICSLGHAGLWPQISAWQDNEEWEKMTEEERENNRGAPL